MGKSRNDLTYEYVNSRLRYEPETGLLFWKERPPVAGETTKQAGHRDRWNMRHAKKEAGAEFVRGRTSYKQIKLNRKAYYAHRLVWLLDYGEWPENQIDHINGNGLDNRVENLRDVTNQENGKNRRIDLRSKFGATGVYFRKQKNKWEASIRVDGKYKYLGCFTSFTEAVRARKEAERKHRFHPNHGRAA